LLIDFVPVIEARYVGQKDIHLLKSLQHQNVPS
jgi:hypothetical protein